MARACLCVRLVWDRELLQDRPLPLSPLAVSAHNQHFYKAEGSPVSHTH